jgi:hypothetical protein
MQFRRVRQVWVQALLREDSGSRAMAQRLSSILCHRNGESRRVDRHEVEDVERYVLLVRYGKL